MAEASSSRVSRRGLLTTAAGAAVVGAGLGYAGAELSGSGRSTGAPDLWRSVGGSGAPRPAGLHVQFGADASGEVVVSWHTPVSVKSPRVLLGAPDSGFGDVVAAETVAYRDGQSGTEVQVHHARISGLRPESDYVYAAAHDGAAPELGTFRTAPRGRGKFTFTSFGDQGTPTLGKPGPADPQGGTLYLNDNLGSPAAGDVTAGVEQIAPLFNLVNGDLCYANLSQDRVRTWSDWFENNTRSARHRPWMPAPGNHENERGNGPIGYQAFQTYFRVPDSGADQQLRGLWYAFTAGSVRIVVLANDDVCYQDAGNTYVRGYSGGAQRRWLADELAKSRADLGIDWIVVCMHQTAVSTVDHFNGADRAIREEWLPLFDQHGVDLVLCGHEHHYERTHPVRGAQPNDTLTPTPVDTRLDEIDATKGTTHLVIGGGGTSRPSNQLFFPGRQCRVITSAGEVDPATGKKAPVYAMEDAPWSAYRDAEHPYGFVAFDVDPGAAGGDTSIAATYYAVTGPYGRIEAVDKFTLRKPRRG
ncbi:MAG: purple acid phosphatase family protein [Segniliparus sp.]|uniref:purple acid phosphatase family protein n=1 Tax=Segniliparus sp. TaxID=2804064 RepID=UPI003F411573